MLKTKDMPRDEWLLGKNNCLVFIKTINFYKKTGFKMKPVYYKNTSLMSKFFVILHLFTGYIYSSLYLLQFYRAFLSQLLRQFSLFLLEFYPAHQIEFHLINW